MRYSGQRQRKQTNQLKMCFSHECAGVAPVVCPWRHDQPAHACAAALAPCLHVDPQARRPPRHQSELAQWPSESRDIKHLPIFTFLESLGQLPGTCTCTCVHHRWLAKLYVSIQATRSLMYILMKNETNFGFTSYTPYIIHPYKSAIATHLLCKIFRKRN